MMRTLVGYIITIIICYVFSAAALIVICPLWNVIGFEVCCCVAFVIGLSWFIPILIYFYNHAKFENLNNKLDELLRRTKKDELQKRC